MLLNSITLQYYTFPEICLETVVEMSFFMEGRGKKGFIYIVITTSTKYPLPQKWQILLKHFLNLLIDLQPIIEEKVFNLW